MKPWTKKDIAEMVGHIEMYCRMHCPSALNSDAMIAAIRANKRDIVLMGVRGDIRRAREYYDGYCGSIGHRIAKTADYVSLANANDVHHSIGLARERLKQIRRAEAMLERINRDGLPPEVEAYDPFPGRAARKAGA